MDRFNLAQKCTRLTGKRKHYIWEGYTVLIVGTVHFCVFVCVYICSSILNEHLWRDIMSKSILTLPHTFKNIWQVIC